MNRPLFLALGALGLALLAGCASDSQYSRPPEPTYETAARNELVSTNYRAADHLLSQVRSYEDDGPMLVATLVNIDALDRSSTLGRLISEQVAARFAQQGRRMIELKLRNNMYMRKSEGELALTREITEVARQHNAKAVLLGSYGLSGDSVFINLKVVQPGSTLVLAAYDYVLPLNREIRSLLGLPR